MGILRRLRLVLVLLGVPLKAGWWCLRGRRRIHRWVGCVGGGNARWGLRMRILDFLVFVFLFFCFFFFFFLFLRYDFTVPFSLSLSLFVCDDSSVFLGSFFRFSFSHLRYTFFVSERPSYADFWASNPDPEFSFSFSCMFFSFGT
jgi:hypothetical protein